MTVPKAKGALVVAAASLAVAPFSAAVVAAPVVHFVSGGTKDLPWGLPAMLQSDDMVGFSVEYARELIAGGHWYALLAGAALVTLFVALALLAGKQGESRRAVEGGVLGDSRLVEDERGLRKAHDFWSGKGEPPAAGLVVGSSAKGYIFDASVPHWAIVGKTGSGKTWLVVLQTMHLCMARSWNLVVTGKEELLELTAEKAASLGYRVVLFDLRGYPSASGFNPVDLVAEYAESGDVDMAQRTARQTAADLIPLGGESNAYFPKAARSALTACLLIVAMADIPRSQKNMASVCNLVNLGTTGSGNDPSAPLKGYIRGPEVGPSHPAYAPAADFLSDGGLTTAGKNVLSTLKEALTVFNDDGMKRITAASGVGIREVVREKTIVYMHMLEEGDPYMALMTVFFNQWWRVAQQEAARNGGRLPHETAIIGDEWGNLPKVDALPEIATLGRSFRLHAWCFTQDLKQWNKYNRPGDQNAGRDKILGCMGGKVALSLAAPEDFQYFTRLAGKRTIRTRNTGSSRQGASMGRSEGYSERADDLIHEWEWQNRAPAHDGLVVIKGAENARPHRAGVFRTHATYASLTPAGAFFGLGSEDECVRKRMAFRHGMEAKAPCGPPPAPWIPDFDPGENAPAITTQTASDEWDAWD